MAKQSKLRKMLSEACIGEFYTQNGYFFKVYPCFDIDKVKFAFVMKGKSGNGFDIYVDTHKFILLCQDIKSGQLYRRIEADKGQYPNAWKYITGDNGSKELAIGKSQKGGIVVQGRVRGDKATARNAFVPLTGYEDLRSMAFWFDLFAGPKPGEGYYAVLYDFFWASYKKKGAYYENSVSEQDEEYIRRENDMTDAPAQNQTPPQPAAITGQFYTDGEFELSQDKKTYRIKTTAKEDGRESFLYFNKTGIDALTEEKFRELFQQVKQKKVLLAIRYAKNQNGMNFLSLVK